MIPYTISTILYLIHYYVCIYILGGVAILDPEQSRSVGC